MAAIVTAEYVVATVQVTMEVHEVEMVQYDTKDHAAMVVCVVRDQVHVAETATDSHIADLRVAAAIEEVTLAAVAQAASVAEASVAEASVEVVPAVAEATSEEADTLVVATQVVAAAEEDDIFTCYYMRYLSAIILSALAVGTATAQTMTDAMRIGTTDIGGTARYRAMGGAFGAVGGDLSCMGDNPAGMGVYRGTSELTITPHLTYSNSSTSMRGFGNTDADKTQFALSNLGVVFSFMTYGNDNLVNFNLGLGIQRKADNFRRYRSNIKPSTRFDEYIASLYNVGGYDEPLTLLGQTGKGGCEAFWVDKGEAFTTINPGIGATQEMDVRESTRMDEYQLSGSFNFNDYFYAGFTLGITDMNSRVESTLDETYATSKPQFLNYNNNIESRGTGFNAKLGILFRPIDELRLGVAVHTPTWTNVKESYMGRMYTEACQNNPAYYDPESWEYSIRTPWEVQVSAAAVLARRAILSAEVDWRFMNSMAYSESRNFYLEGGDSFFRLVNDAISDYAKTQVTVKLGAEVNIAKGLCVRAGYAYKTSPYKDAALNGTVDASTQYDLYYGGTKVDYNTVGEQQYISGGLGYRSGKFGVDLTYVRRITDGKMAAYPANMTNVTSDIIDLKTKTNNFDITFSYRFGK